MPVEYNRVHAYDSGKLHHLCSNQMIGPAHRLDSGVARHGLRTECG